MSNKSILISDYLDEIIPNPTCELKYSKDYELLIAVVLSAQCTDKRVDMVTQKLFSKYKTLEELRDAKDIEEIIRPCGTYNRKSMYIREIVNRLLDLYSGTVPCDRDILESFPGVGRKVCNVIFSELFRVPSIAVDTHVDRVSKRLGLCKKTDNVYNVEKKLCKIFPEDEWCKRHLQLVLFGRYHCKSINPECNMCKLKDVCNYCHK